MKEVHDTQSAREVLETNSADDTIFYHVDFKPLEALIDQSDVSGATFVGCELSDHAAAAIVKQGGAVVPDLDGPYESCRPRLYTTAELFDAFDPDAPCSYCNCFDAKVWRHWRDTGGARPNHLRESLARRLHDYSIDEAMAGFLKSRADKMRGVVAVMGGHSMKRNDPAFAQVALMSQKLAELGYLLATGGGPGAMEATHLGVFFANKPEAELRDAISILSEAPLYKDKHFLAQAFKVMDRYPYADSCPESLGIPTWLYGHEPPNPFPTHIAKFFRNAVREDGLVTIATHGIVFAPGSAGTVQEIFQDATQNHYGTLDGLVSPMVFLGQNYWTEKLPVLPLLSNLSEGKPYADLVYACDEPAEAVAYLEANPPKTIDASGWNVCGLHCGH